MEKVRAALIRIAKTALGDSLPAEMTGKIAKDVISGYDLNIRTGFPDSIPISSQIAASAVVDDAIACGRFISLVERLAVLEREGFMGRTYRIPALRDLLKAIQAEGFLWDENTRRFMENPAIRRTPNWGCMLEHEEYRFSLLKVDIVKNSKLVKRHGEGAAREAYGELRERFTRIVEQRLGRVWKWEGDGGVAAFHYGHSATSAALAGMAFLHDLFLFNRTANDLGEHISVRAASHSGPLVYRASYDDISKQETAKETAELEAKRTPADTLCISAAIARSLDRVIIDRFRGEKVDGVPVFLYGVALEDA
jgi:hypothetical protein